MTEVSVPSINSVMSMMRMPDSAWLILLSSWLKSPPIPPIGRQ